MPDKTQLDILEFVKAHKLDVRISDERDDERASRLRREEADAQLERRLRLLTFLAMLVVLFGILTACLWITIYGQSSEDKKWALSVFSAVSSGSLGFLLGKRQAPS